MWNFRATLVAIVAVQHTFVVGFVVLSRSPSFRSITNFMPATKLDVSDASNETLSFQGGSPNHDDVQTRRKLNTTRDRKFRTIDRSRPSSTSKDSPISSSLSSEDVMREIQRLKHDHEIEKRILDLASRGSASFSEWGIKSQIDFVKILQEKVAYGAIMKFLRLVGRPHVKVCTTAMFSMALCTSHRRYALEILDLMDEQGVPPTSLTLIAVLGSIDGPKAVNQMMKRIDGYRNVQLSAEVFNSAIFACRRHSPDVDGSGPTDWQTALRLLQTMRRKRIQPTIKTYYAILQVLSGTGQVQMAKSIMQQLQSTPGLAADARVWAAAINVCAEAGDYQGAIDFINEMNVSGHAPNLLHSTALLKAFAAAGQDAMALEALDMMMGKKCDMTGSAPRYTLPPSYPDIVALNTVISACAKAGNIESALSLVNRMKAGEFLDPFKGGAIAPDRISYHNVLVSCADPEIAKQIVKEMRLSRRNREGAIPPTSVTYAHAINACQRAAVPDVECASTLISWALDDQVQPTVYMFAPAIWAAQKCGDREAALDFFLQMEDLGCPPTAIVYNGVMSTLCDSGDVEHAILIYGEMKGRGMHTNAAVFKRFALATRSMGHVKERREYLERIVSLMDPLEKTANIGGPVFEALIRAYGELSMIDEALEIFHMITGRVDAPCLRAILSACSIADPPRWEASISILHTSDIVEGSSGPGKIDQLALSNVIIACSKANEYQEGLNLLQLYGRKGSEAARSSGLSVVALNSLIAACGRGQRPDLALELLCVMQQRYGVIPDARSYRNAAIACNKAQHDRLEVRNGLATYEWWECALSLLRRMREGGIVPDVATYSATISACEAAGEWQRALGVLQAMMDDESALAEDDTRLNIFCFNAAISACEKGLAWVEALELYERMLDIGGVVQPNEVTLNSLLVALENAGQKELAQSKYNEGRKLKIVNPWRYTRNSKGVSIRAMDLHRFSGAMAKAAVRSFMEGYSLRSEPVGPDDDLLIITGKGLHSEKNPVLQEAVASVCSEEYGVEVQVDEQNPGRVILPGKTLADFRAKCKW